MRGFDIDHLVEGLIEEGQLLGVTLHEIQTRQLVPFSTKVHAGRVESNPVYEAGRKVRMTYDAPPP